MPGGTAAGREGEDRAAEHLRHLGYRIICRNYRTTLGELDIVAVEGSVLVFVEVKVRGEGAWAPPAAAVDQRKRMRLRRLARQFVQAQGLTGWTCRFDVVAVSPLEVQVFRGAFLEGP